MSSYFRDDAVVAVHTHTKEGERVWGYWGDLCRLEKDVVAMLLWSLQLLLLLACKCAAITVGLYRDTQSETVRKRLQLFFFYCLFLFLAAFLVTSAQNHSFCLAARARYLSKLHFPLRSICMVSYLPLLSLQMSLSFGGFRICGCAVRNSRRIEVTKQ